MSTPTIAIVGAGPAGLYTAQALRRALPDATIDIIDRLAVPFGLLRYGVAPDHQGTKAIMRQFERLFERDGVCFHGGIEVGRDVTLADLRATYDVVVLAAGLAGDRRLGIPGDDLPGVIGSGHFTRWVNDHPDATGDAPPLGRRIAILGAGNVALDVARVLAKTGDEFVGSDLSPGVLAHLAAAGISEIAVISRSAPEVARFEAALLTELARLGATHVRVEVPPATDGSTPAPVLAALRAINGGGAASDAARRRLTFRFGLTPQAIERVDGTLRLHTATSDRSGDHQTIEVDAIISAIGFEAGSSALMRASWSQADGTLPVCIAPGFYAAGWFRRGPRGTIPENRAEAKEVADRIVADLAAGAIGKNGRPPPVPPFANAIPYRGWLAIRDHELAAAPPGRVRQKCATHAAMRALAQGT